MELAAQVSAMVGASAILFYVTKPDASTFCIEELSDRNKLRGCFRYSHYHRQKSLHTVQLRRTATNVSDETSLSSRHSDNSY